jgi:hypothetical protein
MSDVQNPCKLFAGRPEGNQPFRKYENRWEDKIQMSAKEIHCKGIQVDWVCLAQERGKW